MKAIYSRHSCTNVITYKNIISNKKRFVEKSYRIVLIMVFIFYTIPLFSQHINMSGGGIYIGNKTAIKVPGTIRLDSSATLHNYGTVKAKEIQNSGTFEMKGDHSEVVIDSTLVLEKGKFFLNQNSIVLNNSDSAALQRVNGYLIAENSLWGKLIWKIGEASGKKYVVPFVNDSLENTGIELDILEAGAGNGYFEFSTYLTNSDNSPQPHEIRSLRFASAGIDTHALKIADRYWLLNAKDYSEKPVSKVSIRFSESELLGDNSITGDSLILSGLIDNCWKDWTKISGMVNASEKIFQSDSIDNYSVFILHEPVDWEVVGTMSHYDKPVSPAPQLAISDTAYTFTFPVDAKYWGNQIEWAFDSNFSNSQIATSPHDIEVTLEPMSDTLLWVRARDSVSGCFTKSITTLAIVDTMSPKEPPTDTFMTVCSGSSSTVDIPNSQSGKLYKLRIHTTTVDSAMGNDNMLSLNTGDIDTSTVFNVLMTDTLTGDTLVLDSTFIILAAGLVETPLFLEGDTFVYINDSVCYFAAAKNAAKLRYSISSDATIDSITGCVTGITDNFVVKATATGLPGCGIEHNNLSVTVTDIAIPIYPEEKHVITDTLHEVNLVLDSILAGSGGNQIEWATNFEFENSEILTSPATINITLPAGTDTLIYLRSRNNETQKVSKTGTARLKVQWAALSAGLLDKSKWILDTVLRDEFNYLNTNEQDFIQKWALNYCSSNCNVGNNCTSDGSICCNHEHGAKELQYYNSGNDDNGSGGEVYFLNGVAHLTATRISPPFTKPNCNRTFDYKAGMLFSRNTYPVTTPGLFEIRCKTPAGLGAFPAFWLLSLFTEIDIFEHDIWVSGNTRNTHSGPIDWTVSGAPKCEGIFFKQTPCDFSQDWHTFSVMLSETKIIFFVDGKETWSTDRDISNPFPANLTSPVRLIINLAMFNPYDGFEEPNGTVHDFQIDYVRYYRPASDNTSNPPQCLQNLQSGSAKTYESVPKSVIISPPFNNKKIFINNAPFNQTVPIASSRISAVNTENDVKVFYKRGNVFSGLGTAYVAYSNSSGNWFEKRLTGLNINLWGNLIQFPPVKDYLTPVNESLVYYQGVNNELMYFKETGNTWGSYQAYIDHNPLKPINNCAGHIAAMALTGAVFYKGTDNNLWHWLPYANNGKLYQLTTNNAIAGAIVMHPSGFLAFYRDSNNRLRQLYWWLTWHEIVVVNQPILTDNIVIDDANSRVYFIGNDNAIYYYTYNYNTINPADLVKLGNRNTDNRNNETMCNYYHNAASWLTLSHDKKTLFYKGTDGKRWYYFNDHENNTSSRENWNKTPLDYAHNVHGPMAFEASNSGRIFYSGSNARLYAVELADADTPIDCPHVYPNMNIYKTNVSYSDTQVMDENSTHTGQNHGPDVLVYPNPSDNSFKVLLNNLAEEVYCEIWITDISGRRINETRIKLNSASYEWIWDASGLTSSIYFYKIRLNNDKIISGKMIKM